MFFKENNEFGVKSETESLPLINKFFNTKLKHNKEDIFSNFDFENEDYVIEMKTRKLASDKYSTTFITEKKRRDANKEEREVIWVFKYTDGLFYLNFNENKDRINDLPTNTVNTFYGVRTNIDIPISLLIKFE